MTKPRPPPSSASSSPASPPSPSTNTENSNSGGGGDGGNDTPPFQTRTTTTRRNKTLYYQPSVYQFTCRGVLHLHNTPREQTAVHTKPSQKQQQEFNNASGFEGMGAALRDKYSCRGIQSRLRHVADFPLSRSKEEAVQWFEGSPAFRDLNHGHSSNRASSGGGLKVKGGTSKQKKDDEQENINQLKNKLKKKNITEEEEEDEPTETHSSYGTTQVNILTVRPVPIMSPDNEKAQEDHPFGGFGNIANSGMLNPFGSLFGGFFGNGAGGIPSSFPTSSTSSSSMSRSVSSSTRMTRDENGKRVATTVTKTTTVDNGTGKKRVETETTVRHLDEEGGRVETTKQVVEDDDVALSPSSAAGTGGGTGGGEKEKRRHTARSLSPRGFEDSDHPSPFHQSQPSAAAVVGGSGGAVIDPSSPPSPPEVAEIATNLRLGLAVTDGPSSDPDNPNDVVRKSNSNSRRSSSSGEWRKTEYLFRLGRFVSPFMVVSQYYEDKEEEERRRKELTKEYNERRQRQKENRWGSKFSEKQRQEDKSKQDGSSSSGGEDDESSSTNGFPPLPADFPVDTSKLEYYLQRLHTQMEKNASMMEIMVRQVFKPDFPQKVRHSGERILENMGPTAERTGKLMKDVWTMWVNSWDGGSGDDDGRGGGKR